VTALLTLLRTFHVPRRRDAHLFPRCPREMALVAYRTLLRSTRIAFQGTTDGSHTAQAPHHSWHTTHTRAGDMHVLGAARAEARKNFDANRNLAAGSEEHAKSITHAHEVARFLRENVVQGQATEADKYRRGPAGAGELASSWAAANLRPELRIHEHTERGDNEDIKKARGKTTLGGSKCCSA